MTNEPRTAFMPVMPPCVDCGKDGWAWRPRNDGGRDAVCFGCGLLHMSPPRTQQRYGYRPRQS